MIDEDKDDEEDFEDRAVVEGLLAASKAPGTWKRYQFLWGVFEQHCNGRGLCPLPATSSTVLSFVAACSTSVTRVSALRANLSVIKQKHQDAGFSDPTAAQEIRSAVEGALRLAAKDKAWPREREPFPVEALRSWVLTMPDLSVFLWRRNAALVALGFRAMLRPSEIVKLRMEDVRLEQNLALVRVGPSKADQSAKRKPIHLDPTNSPTCPVKLLTEYSIMRRAMFPSASDPFFVSVKGAALSPSAVSSVVSAMAEAAGLTGFFSGHSLRIGGASAAIAGGFTVDEVMAIGAWKSEAVKQYLMPVLAKKNAVSSRIGL